jgi:hypothetical protein
MQMLNERAALKFEKGVFPRISIFVPICNFRRMTIVKNRTNKKETWIFGQQKKAP